jgi:hypothetical protein
LSPAARSATSTSPARGRAVANTNPFDPAATASSGDVWAETVNPNATYTPITLTAGQTGTIMLTFIPSATKGTVVRGFIGVDTFSRYTVAGDELVNIPYACTVG